MTNKLNAKYRLDWKKQNIIKYKNLLSHIKMGKENIAFGDIEIEKHKFCSNKSSIFLRCRYG